MGTLTASSERRQRWSTLAGSVCFSETACSHVWKTNPTHIPMTVASEVRPWAWFGTSARTPEWWFSILRGVPCQQGNGEVGRWAQHTALGASEATKRGPLFCLEGRRPRGQVPGTGPARVKVILWSQSQGWGWGGRAGTRQAEGLDESRLGFCALCCPLQGGAPTVFSAKRVTKSGLRFRELISRTSVRKKCSHTGYGEVILHIHDFHDFTYPWFHSNSMLTKTACWWPVKHTSCICFNY